MYSPTTRLLTVLALLQSHRQITGAEIARRLEVDTRTVRRYITSLQDIGVPVEGERGPHGAYFLGRGSKMPPLMFTDEEAVAITLGLRALREFQFPVEQAAVEGALAKTERALPEKLLHQVRGLQVSITFNTASYGSPLPQFKENQLVVTLSSAVQAQQRVHLHYRSWDGRITDRDFEPYGIVYNEGYWYTAGFCHLRQDLRTFRLDRIQSIFLLEQKFEGAEKGFDLLGFVLGSIAEVPGAHQVEILLKTTLDRAKATVPPYLGTLETTAEGVVMRRTATNLSWIAFVLLELNFPLEVRQPAELRAIFRRIADRADRIA